MSFDAHRNFAYSHVALAPSPPVSGTSLSVSAGEGALFPPPPFNLVIWPAGAIPLASNAEVVRVTARAGDVLTIARAQEGSAARTVTVGDQVGANVTAKMITDLEDALSAAPAAVPTRLAAGATFAVAVDTQALYFRPIQVDGTLHVDGLLASVS